MKQQKMENKCLVIWTFMHETLDKYIYVIIYEIECLA